MQQRSIINYEKINAVMGAKRLSGQKLANMSGVSARTVSDIRNGLWDGNISILKAVVNALGLRIVDVLQEEKEAA